MLVTHSETISGALILVVIFSVIFQIDRVNYLRFHGDLLPRNPRSFEIARILTRIIGDFGTKKQPWWTNLLQIAIKSVVIEHGEIADSLNGR